MQTKRCVHRYLPVLVLIAGFMSGCVPYSTSSTEVGVLVITWNPLGTQGVVDKTYAEGETNFFVPFLTRWYTFQSNLQNLEMNMGESAREDRSGNSLLFKTIDGNDIDLDVIITYRIIREKAPYILQKVAPDDVSLRDYIVRTISRSKPRDIFGELTTEEFYITENRELKANRAKLVLNELLEPYGVHVEAVKTKDYRFNPMYQKAIEERKIADQMAEKNKASARAAEQEYKKRVEQAIGEVNKMTAESDGEFEQGRIATDAYFNQQKEIAQAIDVEGNAEAEALRQLSAALAGPGGEIMVKLKVAESLNGKKILLLPISGGGLDLKTTDINRLLDVYGLQKASEQPPKPKKETAAAPPEQSVEPSVESQQSTEASP